MYYYLENKSNITKNYAESIFYFAFFTCCFVYMVVNNVLIQFFCFGANKFWKKFFLL